jgi:hypothetical protein
LVIGHSQGTGYAGKFAASDGHLLWEKRFNDRYFAAAGTDGDGNILVAGESNGNLYVAKLEGSSGSILWEHHRSGGVDVPSSAGGISVDSNGNAFVAGSIYANRRFQNSDLYLAKLASSDGTVLWETRRSSPGDLLDGVSAITLDRKGDLVIAGVMSLAVTAPFDSQPFTAKYASDDGSLLWEEAGGATLIAVDVNGNIVLSRPENFNFYTALYRDEPSPRVGVSFGDNGNVTLSWPEQLKGWVLQMKVGNSGIGGEEDWTPVSGSEADASITIPIVAGAASTLYRLKQP